MPPRRKPLRIVAKAHRSHDYMQRQLAVADKPGHKVGAAAAYLLAVLARAEHTAAHATADRAVAALTQWATQLEAATVAAAQQRRKERHERRHGHRETSATT